MMRFAPLFFGLLAACQGQGDFYMEIPALELTVDSPTYGDFSGDEPVTVSGTVTDPGAAVFVMERRVPVDASGRFEVQVPVDHAFLNVDVQAFLVDQHARNRVPVFRGQDPIDSWPGGLTARVTPQGLTKLGEQLGTFIDDTGWAEGLAGIVPGALGVTHDPSVVVLKGIDGGLDLAIGLRDVEIQMDIQTDFISGPVSIGYQTIDIGARATPVIDEDGYIVLSLSDGTFLLSDATVITDGSSNFIFELVLEALGWAVGGIGELVSDLLLGLIGDLPLGGPLDFDTDLLGTPVSIRLSELYGDTEGLGVGLGMGIGKPIVDGPLLVPTPGALQRTDFALGVHEGLFQLMLQTELFELLSLLSQEIRLGGILGNVIEIAVDALPGGGFAPDADAWCVSMDPGDARVARLQRGTEPLVVIYVPDLAMNIGVDDGSSVCEPWLDASIALELELGVTKGTKLDLDLKITDGAVFYYGASEEYWTEEEVWGALGGVVDAVVGPAASFLDLDLAELAGVGGAFDTFGDVSPEITGSTQLVDEITGEPVEGLYALSIRLWE
jgi:hypothetical protein